MKKIILAGALALAAAGSWAFYPKQATQPAYMQLIASSISSKGVLIEVSPEGRTTEIPIEERTPLAFRSKTTVELNRLRQNGWRVVQLASRAPAAHILEETYLLEK